MNPYQYRNLGADELSACFLKAIEAKDVATAQEALAQIESRFQQSTSAEKSQQFVDDFMSLVGSIELRPLHESNKLAQCASRVGYLVELAEERALAPTEEDNLRQIAAAAEGGFALIKVLANAPEEGLSGDALAQGINSAEETDLTKRDLLPLICLFGIHGIVSQNNELVKLTDRGRAVLKSVPYEEPKATAMPEQDLDLDLDETLRLITDKVRRSKWSRMQSRLAVVKHEIRERKRSGRHTAELKALDELVGAVRP